MTSIEASVLNRLRDVRGLRRLAALEIGDGARDLEHAMIGPRRQRELRHRGRMITLRVGREPAEAPHIARAHVRVGTHALPALEPVALNRPRSLHPRARSRRSSPAAPARRGPATQRPGPRDGCRSGPAADPRFVPGSATMRCGEAVTLAHRIAAAAAGARIHRRRQHEPRGIREADGRAAERDHPVLERLSQHLEDVAPELRKLVEKEHAALREAHLAGPGRRAAADEARIADRVMRRAEGTRGTAKPGPAPAARRPSAPRSFRALRRARGREGFPATGARAWSCRRRADR